MKTPKLWFVTGSQHLYGPQALEQVDNNSKTLVAALQLPLEVEFKGVLTTPSEIREFCIAANAAPECAGVVLWMHTFSPSKMWIGGLSQLQKPFCHLHTQFNRDLPWDSIDMDFMNLNQAAHGDREAGFMHTRMRLERKVVVGHYSDPEVQQRLGVWASAAHAWHSLQGAKFCRFGDNMRYVAVTEGDKVAAEMRFGFEVNTYGVGDLVAVVNAVPDSAIDQLLEEYHSLYDIAPELLPSGARHASLRYSARLELGIEKFLVDGDFKGFTTTFEDLHGLDQLPGMAVQRLMAKGYGFAGEGDWKTAALLSALKTMAGNVSTSFMEDYTYHLEPDKHQVLGSHMLEICPTITAHKPKVEIHPLGIGGKQDPVRLVFDAQQGQAINVSLVDLGSRFRLIVNEVTAVEPPAMPKLPVARTVWECKPDFKTACAAWIYAGGAHHTVYSYVLTSEHIEDFAAIAGVELVVIDDNTNLRDLKRELKFSDLYYALGQGLKV